MRAGEICHWPLFHCLLTLSHSLSTALLFYYSIFSEIYFWNAVLYVWKWRCMNMLMRVERREGGQCLTSSFLHPLIRKIFAHTFSFFFFLAFFITDKHNYNNEMTRQFPVMQLQSFNYPKNVSMLSSPSLTTSSLINNNSLLTFRDIMMQQQQYQLHQQQMLQHEHHRAIKNETENCIQPSSSISLTNALSSSSSSSLSPNTLSTSTTKMSPKHQQQYHSQSLVTAASTAEKHERAHHTMSIKQETGASSVENGNKINNSANRFNKAETYHHQHHNNNQSSSNSGGSGRTVREELEASRCKIPKLGEFLNPIKTTHICGSTTIPFNFQPDIPKIIKIIKYFCVWPSCLHRSQSRK